MVAYKSLLVLNNKHGLQWKIYLHRGFRQSFQRRSSSCRRRIRGGTSGGGLPVGTGYNHYGFWTACTHLLAILLGKSSWLQMRVAFLYNQRQRDFIKVDLLTSFMRQSFALEKSKRFQTLGRLKRSCAIRSRWSCKQTTYREVKMFFESDFSKCPALRCLPAPGKLHEQLDFDI